jgi:hypothetical protein
MSSDYCSKCEQEIRTCDDKFLHDEDIFCSEECKNLFMKDGRIGLSKENEEHIKLLVNDLPKEELIEIIVKRMPYRAGLKLIEELQLSRRGTLQYSGRRLLSQKHQYEQPKLPNKED